MTQRVNARHHELPRRREPQPAVLHSIEQHGGLIRAKVRGIRGQRVARRALWLGASCIYEFTDSMVALSAMRSLTPSTTVMQQLVSERLMMAASNGCRLVGDRISTSNNLWADL